AWCLGSDAVTSAISANIAVTIGADVLAGFVPGFAESADGRWAVPAQWITDVVTQKPRPWASAASQAARRERQRAPGVSGEERAAAA
ncbi:MAG: hypothetical protein ABWX74_11880, partial [Aeromicrobium sp.]